jgi:capsular polysaccharide biosynthesis protein
MSEQALDLRKSMHIVRRHRTLVGIFAALGLLAGAVFTALNPPVLTTSALVELQPTLRDLPSQVVIAGSDPVLRSASHNVDPPVSVQDLRKKLVVKSLATNLIEIEAHGSTAAQAENTANVVAQSYIAYLSSPGSPGGAVPAQLLQRATIATQTPLAVQLLVTEGIGALLGLVIGAIIAMAISRGDKRLRERDEIADSIGVPVLASIPVGHPSGPAGWTKLLQDYEPGVVHAWRLRNALQYLGLTGVSLADLRENHGSLAVVSLASDTGALALGPQLAVFAASLGIPTALIIGPQQDPNATATLRAACAVPSAAPSRRSNHLQVAVADHESGGAPPEAALTIVVSVVDERSPRVADTMPATTTVLGLTAGGATAAQLARVAVSAAAVGRQITGIFVADPDRTDKTTGRIPQLTRPEQMMPTRLTSKSPEPRASKPMETRVSKPTETRVSKPAETKTSKPTETRL